MVLYYLKSKQFLYITFCFKGTVHQDFQPPFFIIRICLATDQWVELFLLLLLLGIRRVIWILGLKNWLAWGDWLVGIPQGVIYLLIFLLTRRVWFPGRYISGGIIPRGDWKIRITRQIPYENLKYFNPLVSGPGRSELRKNGSQSYHLTVPLTNLF